MIIDIKRNYEKKEDLPKRSLTCAPIVPVSGNLTDAPDVYLMDGQTGYTQKFNPDNFKPSDTFAVVGYSQNRNAPTFVNKRGIPMEIAGKFMGKKTLENVFKLIQGRKNPGFQTIYLIPVGREVA